MANSSIQELRLQESTLSAAHYELSVVIYFKAARLDRVGFGMLRIGLVVVLCWIGGLKAANYEAEGIVPFVANSPLMRFSIITRHLSIASKVQRVD